MTNDRDPIQRWVQQSDPTDDPITGAEVRRAAGEISLSSAALSKPLRNRARLALAAAAVLVVAVGVVGAVMTTTDDDHSPPADPSTVTSYTTGGSGQLEFEFDPAQVDGPDAGPGAAPTDRAVAVMVLIRDGEPPSGEVSAVVGSGATLGGSMVPGGYELRYRELPCPTAGCPEARSPSGMIGTAALADLIATVEPSIECATTFTIDPGQLVRAEINRLPAASSTSAPTCEVWAGTGTRVVVSAENVPTGTSGALNRYVVIGADGEEVVDGLFAEGTALVLDRPLPPADYLVRREVYWCPDSCEDGATGLPVEDQALSPDLSCRTLFSIRRSGDELVRVNFEGEDGCTTARPDVLPALTVPPAWSLRTRLPSTCAGPEPARRSCFLAAHRNGHAAEMMTTEARDDQVAPVWWRTRGGVFTVWRPLHLTTPPPGPDLPAPSWTWQRCDLTDAVDEAGSVEPTGCGEQRPLSNLPG